MICKTCGGEIPKGTRVCPFCETECIEGAELVKERMEQLTAAAQEQNCEEKNGGAACGSCGCGSCGEGDGGGCGETGLTDPAKGVKYGLFLVGLVVVIIGVAFVLKMAASLA